MTLEEWYRSPLRLKAYYQGWRISDIKTYENMSGPEYRITRTLFSGHVNPRMRFFSDMDAREFVKQQAEQGDELAITALNVLLTEKLSGA